MPKNNSNTDVSKLKFLSGTLRDDKQGTYDYMGLFKQALNQLGVIYPSSGGGSYVFQNGITKDVDNNVGLGGAFTQTITQIGDSNQCYILFDMDGPYTSMNIKTPAPTVGSAEVSIFAQDDYSQVYLQTIGDFSNKSQYSKLSFDTDIVGNYLTASRWFVHINEATIVSSVEIDISVDNANNRTCRIVQFGEGRSLTIYVPDVSAFTGSPTYTIPLTVNGNVADAAGNIVPARAYAPTSSADAAGNEGDITYDASFVYVKTASGWRRSALSSF